MNIKAGQTRAAALQLGLSGNGQVTMVASTTVKMTVDVVSYFAWDAQRD